MEVSLINLKYKFTFSFLPFLYFLSNRKTDLNLNLIIAFIWYISRERLYNY